jgi:hypothetical protein
MFFLFTSDYKCIFSNKEVGQLYQVSESKTYLSPFTKRLAWERERERELWCLTPLSTIFGLYHGSMGISY